MARHHTVRVPAAQAARVLDALVAAYARKADALGAAARAYRADREPLAAVVDARREVIDAEAALDAIGWELGDRTAELELAGPAGAVREILYTALLAAAEAARTACRDYERGRLDRAALAAAVAGVTGLHGLFAALEEADSPEAVAGAARVPRLGGRARDLGRRVATRGPAGAGPAGTGRLVAVPSRSE